EGEGEGDACGGCSSADECHQAICQVTNGVGACVDVDLSACATPFCALPASNCATWVDSDGDGLSDAWEQNGYVALNCNRVNCGPDVDIEIPGADPAVPDIFVYFNYMVSTHSHEPSATALDQVVQAFALQNIALHFEDGGAIAETAVTTIEAQPTAACSGTDV